MSAADLALIDTLGRMGHTELASGVIATADGGPRLCAGCMTVEVPDDKRYCSTNCFRQEDGEDRDED